MSTPVEVTHHEGFTAAARHDLRNAQQRKNLRKATTTIRAKRQAVVDEVPEWEALRDEGKAAKERAMARLDEHLVQLEASVTAAGGTVHWARDAAEAGTTVLRVVREAGSTEAIKVKSLATDELGLNETLAAGGVTAHETDLAELIVQLGHDRQSHILVPAIHRNRAEIRELFRAKLPGAADVGEAPPELAEAARRHLRELFRAKLPGAADVGEAPPELAEAARRHLRELFLTVGVGISGANAAVAETGTVGVVESEGNGRMCTTLPHTLITVMGIEKVLPDFSDLDAFLQLLPRSSTGERMNPYTSLWTGVTPGDGPQAFHLVLVDAGRTDVLADPVGREALHCIRCSACLNVCPVYERAGGHAYGSTYPGPIGAVLAPQLAGMREHTDLPWASSLCGACYEVCPVKIDIPKLLIHLRGRVIAEGGGERGERVAMEVLGRTFAHRRRYEAAQKLAALGGRPLSKDGRIEARLPGPLKGWLAVRDLPAPPRQSFRAWWKAEGRA